jgi:hypothetical protein
MNSMHGWDLLNGCESLYLGDRVPTIIETLLEVIAEAIESASVARSRYPLAD